MSMNKKDVAEQSELKQLSTLLQTAEELARKISAFSPSRYVQQRLDPMASELEDAQEILDDLLSFKVTGED